MVPIGGGQAAGASCMPIGGAQQQTQGYWQNRYAAVAIGIAQNGGGSFGASTDHTSKRRAEKAAKAQCSASGAKECEIMASYYNQCAVVAWGDTGSSTSTGPDIDEVTQRVLSRCNATYKNCRIYY
jgi:hypothetical protein